MSVHSPDRPPREWNPTAAADPVMLVLSSGQLAAGDWAGIDIGGHPVEAIVAELSSTAAIDLPGRALAAVVEVSEARPESIERFAALGKGEVPLVAAAYNPPLAFIRQLIRMGAHDVIPLPIERAELE